MSLVDKYDLGSPKLIYSPTDGGIGIYEVVNLGSHSRAVFLGML